MEIFESQIEKYICKTIFRKITWVKVSVTIPEMIPEQLLSLQPNINLSLMAESAIPLWAVQKQISATF